MAEKSGEVFLIKDGAGNGKYLQQSPYVSIACSLADQFQLLELRFDMNPSARTHIEVENTDEQGGLAHFLRLAQ